MDGDFVSEVPRSLKRLARLVTRGFYTFEHVILMDMLIRHPCMKEDDIAEFIKFERKQLRALLANLKNDRLIKVRLRMETGPDGKASRQNYYYINYKVFVNVVKYKLDHIRRKIETEERDSASRASFKCNACMKTFTDLEADQLIDFTTGEFKCSFCSSPVIEDESAVPKQDSRTLIAKFNEQIEPLYVLLREVEDIKLAPFLLEPEPTDVSHLKTDGKSKPSIRRPGAEGLDKAWSGDATRNKGFGLENSDVTINFDDSKDGKDAKDSIKTTKELPIWMKASTVNTEANPLNDQQFVNDNDVQIVEPVAKKPKQSQPDIMSVLLAHEKKPSKIVIPGSANQSDTSESEDEVTAVVTKQPNASPDVEIMESDDEDEIPMVTIGDMQVPYDDVTPELIAKMSQTEKDNYIRIGQEVYANIYD